MKQRGRIITLRLSRYSLLLFVSLLLILSFGCDLNFQFPTIPSFKRPPRKNDLLADLNGQLATISEATITLKGDDIIFYFDDPIDTEYLASTIQSVFDKLTVVTDDWSISIKDTAYSPQKAVEELVERVGQFSHIWEEEVGYSAQVTYKGYPFSLSGEFVFQDIFMKLMSTEELAAFHTHAYLAVHQSTIELDIDSVTFNNAHAVIRALSDYERLLGISQDLLTTEKEHLEDLLKAIQDNATEEENQLISSWLSLQNRITVKIPYDMIDNPRTDLLSYIDIEGLRQTHDLVFLDKKDGDQITLYPSDGASTFIVYMEATPKDDSGDPISKEVIIKIGSVFIGKGAELYTIEDAIELAGSDDIFVRYNTSFASAEVAEQVYGKTTYRIGSPTTLVLPYDENLSSGINDIPKKLDQDGNVQHVTAGPITRSGGYVRLTVPEGITIDLKGRLVVNAKRAAYATKFQGHVTGKNYSVLNLEENSKINVEYRGELYVLGFVEGEGEIEVESGGYVYEGMFISSFRGGTATSRIEEYVFPFDQFTVMQIESPLIINNGGNYIAKALIWAGGRYTSGDFALVGNNAVIRMMSGNVTKAFNASSGHVTITLDGKGSINNGGVKVGSLTATTDGKAIPFDGTWHFIVSTGSTLDIEAKVALLPGSSLTIESGAVVVVKEGTDEERGWNELTIFSDRSYQDGYNEYPNATVKNYYRKVPDLDYAFDSKARVLNSGTIEIEKNSGIAGHVTNSEVGNISWHADAKKSYGFYIVEGSVDTANAKKITVTYQK